jgi:hypothetical protein
MAAAMQDELFRRARAEGSKHSPYAKKEVADFGKIYHQLRWDIGFVGVQVGSGGSGGLPGRVMSVKSAACCYVVCMQLVVFCWLKLTSSSSTTMLQVQALWRSNWDGSSSFALLFSKW